MYTTRIEWEVLRTVNTATSPFSTGVYTPIGGPLLFPSYILKIVNNSNQLITVSNDGINDKDVAPAGSIFLYDEDEGNPSHIALPAGTQLYIRGTGAVGTGLVYMVTQYLIIN
jgi:hypothetical protein